MSDVKKVLIIGSGPAGYTAAIYCARANMEPVLFEGNQPGGQLTITTDVENYPGFPDGVLGPEMMELFKKQAMRFGTSVIPAHVRAVDFGKRPYRVWTTGDEEYAGESVIISTGASANYLGLKNELALQGRGVSACATCDGFFFKGKDVHVVGGGDSAMEEATFLTKYATAVHVVVRRDQLRASKIMQDRALANPKVHFVWNSEVTDVHDVKDGKVTGVEVLDHKSGKKAVRKTDGLFLAIGHTPNTAIFKDWLPMDDKGYLQTVPGRTATKIPGVFACGDCMDSYYRQAVTAAGTGCMAALEAERWLSHEQTH
jgi:thioredoxin reductase (NADPH)